MPAWLSPAGIFVLALQKIAGCHGAAAIHLSFFSMRYSLLLASSTGLLLAACGSGTTSTDLPTAGTPTPTAGWVDADLITTDTKLPLVVKAPKGYTVAKSPLGDVELTSEALTFDVDDVTGLGADQLQVKKEGVMKNSGMTFEKLVLDQPDGFIAQMGGSNYIPVRLVKVGDKTYQFSTIPLNALQSEEAAKQVYDMAALAKAK